MVDYTILPLESHDNKSVFLEHAWNIGRAYRNQALELISICTLLSRVVSPNLAHEDAELRRLLGACDLALRSAADSGTKVTDQANARFKEATRVLSGHSERKKHLDLPLIIHSKMEIAKWKDSVQRDRTYVVEPTITINFVLLRSPLLDPHDPEPVIVSQEVNLDSSLPEILWNFSRYKDRGRITLEQNPHFYLRCPADESVYTPMLQLYPLQDTRGALEHNGTVYVLFDRPGRVFLEIEHKRRIFGNVWSLNGSLIFRDRSGVLEGEQLVRGPTIRSDLWYCERPVVYHDPKSHPRLNHSCLRSIVTTPSADPSSEGTFEDWTVLSHPASHSIDIHIYGPRGSHGSTRALDLPPPPTSERPGYCVLYTTINTLNDDILLCVFDYYRLDKQNDWNVLLGWRKLSHVCRRWRHLVYSSAFHLDIRIQCTYGTPIVDTLDHLPFLPLNLLYGDAAGTTSEQDELGIHHALLLRDRVRSIDLSFPPLILHKFFVLMDEPFPILEDLRLFSTADERMSPKIPKTFLAPNLRSVILVSIGLPKGLSLLSSTASLVTLKLLAIQTSDYLFPRKLVSRLRSLPQLENLVIDLSHDNPHWHSSTALGKLGIPVTLPSLKDLTFDGSSAYLECLVAQIRAPRLEKVNIMLFSQTTFALPHLAHFINITEGLKLPTAEVCFRSLDVSLNMDKCSTPWRIGSFFLSVRSKQLDQQILHAIHIFRALILALSGVETLRLGMDDRIPMEEQTSEVNSTTWHDLLRPFIGAKELRICPPLSQELSWALQEDDVGSDPEFLPCLQELVSEFLWEDADAPFDSFIHARRVADRPVRSLFLRSNPIREKHRVHSAPRQA